METNPVHRIWAALGLPYGSKPVPHEKGVAGRRRLAKIARASRRFNTRNK